MFRFSAIPANSCVYSQHNICNVMNSGFPIFLVIGAIIKYLSLLITLGFLAGCGLFEPEDDDFIGSNKLDSDFGTYAILKSDGSLWTWGWNMDGMCGQGTTDPIDKPTRIDGLPPIVDFDLYEGNAAAVDMEGDIWYWGAAFFVGYRPPPVFAPIRISHLTDTKKIDLLGQTVHLLREDGSVWQFSIDYQVDSSFYRPEIIPGMTDIQSISHCIALKHDGTLVDLKTTAPDHGGAVPVDDVIAVQNHWNRRTVVLKGDGSVWAWGQNSIGELGNGTYTHSAIPTQVVGLDQITQISAEYDYNLALRGDGTVWFWGFTTERDENDKPIGINQPVPVESLYDIELVYASPISLVMQKDGTYWSFHASDRIPAIIAFE